MANETLTKAQVALLLSFATGTHQEAAHRGRAAMEDLFALVEEGYMLAFHNSRGEPTMFAVSDKGDEELQRRGLPTDLTN